MKTLARTVGRYELVRVIGRGGMATVYLAHQADLDRDIALKELALSDGADPEIARRFLREARLAGSLSHPNIVTVHDYLEQDGTPYIAMEYLERGSLRPYVGRMSIPQVGGVLRDMLAGLALAEEHGIVHRDIKPENVMVTSQGSVKIADFGIAKATSAATTSINLTITGTTLGTPRYMAPERAMGQEIGPWSDLYSVGVMAFELLVGHTPFHDTEVPMAILMRQINDPVPPVSSLEPDVDPAISDWVEHLLIKDPDARQRSAAGASSELDEILVDVLGARWLRDAPLPARPEQPPADQKPATRAIAPARRRPATRTQPMQEDEALSATVAPATLRVERERARRRGRRFRGMPRIALVVGMLIVVVAAAAAVRPGDEPGEAGRVAAVTAGNGEVGLTAPSAWHESTPGSRIPLPLHNPITLARADGGSVTAGLMPGETAANVSLLPPELIGSLGLPAGQIPSRDRAILRSRGFEAWRYRDLRPDGSDRPLTVYAVPTTAGVAAVACAPPPAGGGGFSERCSSIANTLRIAGARAYRVGPSPAYAKAIETALRVLQARAKTHGAALAAAGTPTAKAAVLQTLAGDYDGAARSLERLDLSPADHATNGRLVAALEKTAGAYREAAAAAGRGDDADAPIGDGEAAMDGALASLRAAGYATGAGDAGSSAPVEVRTGETGTGALSGGSRDDSGVGDSRSDDPSDDEPDEDDNGD